MEIISYMGVIDIYKDAEYDSSIGVFRGGVKVAEIPYAGHSLYVKTEQVDDEPIVVEGVEIPTESPLKWISVDPLPEGDDPDTMYIVPMYYVAACKELGLPTDKLLTMGQPVVDDTGRFIGCVAFIRN